MVGPKCRLLRPLRDPPVPRRRQRTGPVIGAAGRIQRALAGWVPARRVAGCWPSACSRSRRGPIGCADGDEPCCDESKRYSCEKTSGCPASVATAYIYPQHAFEPAADPGDWTTMKYSATHRGRRRGGSGLWHPLAAVATIAPAGPQARGRVCQRRPPHPVSGCITSGDVMAPCTSCRWLLRADARGFQQPGVSGCVAGTAAGSAPTPAGPRRRTPRGPARGAFVIFRSDQSRSNGRCSSP